MKLNFNKQLLTIIVTFSLIIPTRGITAGSNDECYVFFDCFQHYEEDNDSEGAAIAAILIGAGIYAAFMMEEDPFVQARILKDYQQGRGFRLNNYHSDININTLSIEFTTPPNHYSTNFTAEFQTNYQQPELRVNLFQITREW